MMEWSSIGYFSMPCATKQKLSQHNFALIVQVFPIYGIVHTTCNIRRIVCFLHLEFSIMKNLGIMLFYRPWGFKEIFPTSGKKHISFRWLDQVQKKGTFLCGWIWAPTADTIDAHCRYMKKAKKKPPLRLLFRLRKKSNFFLTSVKREAVAIINKIS